MNPSDYSKYATSLDANYPNVIERMNSNEKLYNLMHGSLGLSGETGECVDMIKKAIIFGKQLDIDNIKEECGDILYYMNVILTAIDSSFEEVMQQNYNKLSKRFPNGFSEKSAIERLDKK